MDPRESQMRRQMRQQERKQQEALRKKRSLRNGIIAIASVLAVILIIVVVGTLLDRPDKSADGEQTTAATYKPGEVTTIHLAAAGDLNVTDRVINAGGTEQDYTDAFLDVAHVFGQADVAVVNFEGVLCGAPYTDRSAPQSMADALAKAGVDLIQLANSYSIHRGVSGLRTTIDSVRDAGMTPLGVYENRAAYRSGKGYVICEVKGIRIAFVSFTKGMDGMALPGGSENCVNVLYEDYASAYQTVDTAGIKEILDATAAAEPDITVALLHWGSEYNDNISKSQETIRNLLLENGVDAIIGTHSHFVQKMELDPENGTFVAYSLGDFFGEAPRSGSEYSVILDLEITKNHRTGKTTVSSFGYTPIFSVRESGKPMRVVRIDSAMKAFESAHIDAVSQETYDDMKYALGRIDARITGEEE